MGKGSITWVSGGAQASEKKTTPLALPSAVLSVGMMQCVLHDGPNGHPCLLGRGDDLRGWQQEAVAPRVPELEAEGVLDATVIGPVNCDPAGHIWGQKEEQGVFGVGQTQVQISNFPSVWPFMTFKTSPNHALLI